MIEPYHLFQIDLETILLVMRIKCVLLITGLN